MPSLILPSRPFSPVLSSISDVLSPKGCNAFLTNSEATICGDLDDGGSVSSSSTLVVDGFDMMDGNVFIQTRETLHRAHWSVLCQHSSFFQDLYPHNKKIGIEADTIIVCDDVSPNEMRCLLSLIYPSDLDPHSQNDKHFWISALRAAHELSFPSAYALAVRRLFSLASPIDKITLGHHYDISTWLLDAYIALCTRDELITTEEGDQLGVREVVAINRAQRELSSRTMCPDEVRYVVWRVCCPSLEVPELVAMHAQRLSEEMYAKTDPLLAAALTTARHRAEKERQQSLLDHASERLTRAEECEHKLRAKSDIPREIRKDRPAKSGIPRSVNSSRSVARDAQRQAPRKAEITAPSVGSGIETRRKNGDSACPHLEKPHSAEAFRQYIDEERTRLEEIRGQIAETCRSLADDMKRVHEDAAKRKLAMEAERKGVKKGNECGDVRERIRMVMERRPKVKRREFGTRSTTSTRMKIRRGCQQKA